MSLESEETNSIADIISSKYDPQIEIEGNLIYKATYLKNCFSSNPLSRDRLRRVRGLTRYEESGSENNLDDNSLMIGDPLVVKTKGNAKICVILNIKKANQNEKTIELNEINNFNTLFSVQELKLESIEDNFVWMEEKIEEPFNVLGIDCCAIQPQLKEVNGKLCYTFRKDLITELAVSVHDTNAHSSSSSETSSVLISNVLKVSCITCKLMIPLNRMREHVGSHIVRKILSGPNVCGFCGDDSCVNTLTKTSSKGKQTFYKTSSNCRYFVNMKKTPKFSQRNPCSNHLILCNICNAAFWTYNLQYHYEQRHPNVTCPELITDEELLKMKKLLY